MFWGYCFCGYLRVSELSFSRITPSNASEKIPPDILLVPKTRFTKIIGILISLLMVISTPMQVLAATPEYVSDLRISVAATEEEAKAKLSEIGYTIFDGDLNAGAGKNSDLCVGVFESCWYPVR